jgi:hypothetical protein
MSKQDDIWGTQEFVYSQWEWKLCQVPSQKFPLIEISPKKYDKDRCKDLINKFVRAFTDRPEGY